MSDFISEFWSYYVAIITLVGILACAALLYVNAKKKKISSEVESTGHVWDEDLKEMNNPLPLWWVGLFVISIVFGVCYLVLYPGLGANKGELNWSSRAEYDAEVASSTAALAPIYARFDAMPIPELSKDPQASAVGNRLFMNNCSQCHGSDAQGSKGFPNLTDHDWLHGGEPDNIVQTITQGRVGQMPPMAAALGSAKAVGDVAQYFRAHPMMQPKRKRDKPNSLFARPAMARTARAIQRLARPTSLTRYGCTVQALKPLKP